jgi:hypothetical protein
VRGEYNRNWPEEDVKKFQFEDFGTINYFGDLVVNVRIMKYTG